MELTYSGRECLDSFSLKEGLELKIVLYYAFVSIITFIVLSLIFTGIAQASPTLPA